MSFFHVPREIPSTRRPRSKQRVPLLLEVLEDRSLMSASTTGGITGFVYLDANNNGIFDPGETVIPNAQVQLLDSANKVVASTTTDANGHYAFTIDQRINTDPSTITIPVTFATDGTDWTQTQTVKQFDPTLGQLTEVEIVNQGAITSDIQVESKSKMPATIHAVVSGHLALSGPSLSSLTATVPVDETFNASAFDGKMDFAGASGIDFGPQTADGSSTFLLTRPNALAAYIGTSTVSLTETATATSTASGPGRMVLSIDTTANATAYVIYHYLPSNALRPGNYTIVQSPGPAGTIDGQNTAGNVTALPVGTGKDQIPVTYTGTELDNNNFGDLKPNSLSGVVYLDSNNDGKFQVAQGDRPINGDTVTLTGTNDLGQTVNLTTQTAIDGVYHFAELRPGTYSLNQGEGSGFLGGKDSIGTQGGTTSIDHFSNIVLTQGIVGTGNNFAELASASLSGFVYQDMNDNGRFEPGLGDKAISGDPVTLTGTNDLGQTINLTMPTGTDGSYHFTNLRPGTYALSHGEGSGLLDGKDAIGSQGGTVGHDQFIAINLNPGVNGVNNNFAELPPSSLSGYVYMDFNNNGQFEPNLGEPGIGGVSITLSGVNDLSQPVNQSTQTAPDGSYSFANLRPGTYSLVKTPPSGLKDGKTTVGTQATGHASPNQVANITLGAGIDGTNNNFAELLPTAPPTVVPKPEPAPNPHPSHSGGSSGGSSQPSSSPPAPTISKYWLIV